MKERFEELIEGFIHNKAGISDLFLPEDLAKRLRQDLMNLHMEGQMAMAGVGSNANRLLDQQIRRDKIYWLDKANGRINELEFLDYVDQFVDYLNSTCYTGINDYEFHFAVYEAGSFYKRHLDQFKNNSGRKFSLISYLNEDWTETDGGQLVLHHDELQVDYILPTNRRAVFFKSDELEHEVALSHRPRMSITGWLKRV